MTRIKTAKRVEAYGKTCHFMEPPGSPVPERLAVGLTPLCHVTGTQRPTRRSKVCSCAQVLGAPSQVRGSRETSGCGKSP